MVKTGDRVWQVDFKGGDNRHFEHYPTLQEISFSLQGDIGSKDIYTEDDLWEEIEGIYPCLWH